MEKTKYCNGCYRTLTLGWFRTIKSSGRPASRCINCEPKYQREYRQRNKVWLREKRQSYYHFGDDMRIEAYAKRLQIDPSVLKSYVWSIKDKRCEICYTSAKDNRWSNLVIDHDHDTGNIRGLLCGNCNKALGLFDDAISNLEDAIRYLKKYKKKPGLKFEDIKIKEG